MNQTIHSALQQLEQYIAQAWRSGNKYDFIDPACELCAELEEGADRQLLQPLLQLIERSPAIDYGGPGPLGSLLESFYDARHVSFVYEDALLASLARKPTAFTLHLLHRLLNDRGHPRRGDHLALMKRIATDPAQAEAIRNEATESLGYFPDLR